jgi:hypothetical protein
VSSCTGARCTRRRVESRTARAETLRCSRMHARTDADRPHRPGHFPAPTSARHEHKPSRSARFKKSLPFYFRIQRFPFAARGAALSFGAACLPVRGRTTQGEPVHTHGRLTRAPTARRHGHEQNLIQKGWHAARRGVALTRCVPYDVR